MGKTKQDRVRLYTMMYIAISKATAENKNAKGETIKTVFNGKVTDLFKGLDASTGVISCFLWVMSHKTNALPVALFKIDKKAHGVEIARIHSGFYDASRKHIVGTDLVPFIMLAMKEFTPKQRSPKEKVAPKEIITPKNELPKFDVCGLSDDELTGLACQVQKELNRREERREKQAKLQQVLELAEMSKEELMDLLGAV